MLAVLLFAINTKTQALMQDFHVEIIPTGQLQANCYIFWNTITRAAFVVDPGYKSSKVTSYIDGNNLDVQSIFITHVHFDHNFGSGSLRKHLSTKLSKQIPILCPRDDAEFWIPNVKFAEMFGVDKPADYPEGPDSTFTEKDEFEVGGGFTMKVLLTPGHTPGSSILYIPKANIAFTGDTIFAQGCGRSDFPGGSAVELRRSIRRIYNTLPEDMVVYSGHGDPGTVAGNKRSISSYLGMLN